MGCAGARSLYLLLRDPCTDPHQGGEAAPVAWSVTSKKSDQSKLVLAFLISSPITFGEKSLCADKLQQLWT